MQNLFGNIYKGKRVLVTGHNGFKGSWLTLWLKEMGASVNGISLSPLTDPNHWDLLGLDIEENLIDIRDYETLMKTVNDCRPEIVFHLAAQPLVRKSYYDPLETWSTNVMGTANLLEACRQCENIKAIVVVTTDKCYENKEWLWGYRENDRLGGHDPYSASKAGTEFVAASYRQSFFNQTGSPLLATARAGNVIGGGDWSEDRLIPDVARSVKNKEPLIIRSPNSTRPWQHVLESISGYLLLGQKLLTSNKLYADAWNFGPGPEGNQTVNQVLSLIESDWPELKWKVTNKTQPHEAVLLQLDSTKSSQKLLWKQVWPFSRGILETAKWYKRFIESGDVITLEQIKQYVEDARGLGIIWTTNENN